MLLLQGKKEQEKGTAMKMFNKSDCEYKGGYIVSDGEVVAIDNEIVDLFNKLEEDIQHAEFERTNCGAAPCWIEPGEFHRSSEHGKIMPFVTAKTPELDKLAEQAIKIMDEIDDFANAEKVNDYFNSIKPLIVFVNEKFIVSGEQASQHRFDLPTIGNPLELDGDKLSQLVIDMFA